MHLIYISPLLLFSCVIRSHAKVAISNVEDDIDFLKCELADLWRSNDELRKNYDDLKRSNDDLGKSNDALRKSNDDLKRSNDDLKRSNDDMKRRTYDDLKRSNDDMRQLNNDMKRSYREMKDENKVQNVAIDKLTTVAEQLNISTELDKRSNEKIQKENNAQSVEIGVLKVIATQLNISTELDKRSNDIIQEQNKAQNVEIDHLKAAVVQLNISLTGFKNQTSNISKSCKSLPIDVCGKCSCIDDSTLVSKYYCDCQWLPSKRDCLAFYEAGHHVSGVYRLKGKYWESEQVYCDQETDGGGWTLIQRRMDGKTNFYRDWASYKAGFGVIQREFWIGNDHLHLLTSTTSELRVDMMAWDASEAYAKYSSIVVDDEGSRYTLHVSGYSGNAGDSLGYHNNQPFSTYDRNNDGNGCAKRDVGAWWYGYCAYVNLNGEYIWYEDKYPNGERGITWTKFKGYHYSLKSVQMKIRRKP